MKKLKRIIYLLIIFTFFISACGNRDNIQNLHLVADAKTDSFETEKDLDSSSSIIIKATKTEAEKNHIESLGKPNQYHGWTISEVVIESIIKNDSAISLEEGDTVPILENQFSFFDTEKMADITVHVNRYVKMQPGNEYILYADYSEDDGWYVITGGIFGKINIDVKEPLIYNASEDPAFNEEMSSLRKEVLNKTDN